MDLQSELKASVISFHVSELAEVLTEANLSKQGRKHELLTRTLQLLKSSDCDNSVYAKIVQVYSRRFPKNATAIRLKYGCILNAVGNKQVKSKTSSKRPNNLEVDVKFKDLPFYEHISNIMPSSKLAPSGRSLMQSTLMKFRITKQQALKISSGINRSDKGQIKYDYQVQLRFCLLDTNTEQADLLPPSLIVKVNRSLVALPPFFVPSKLGTELKRLNQPIDITSICRNYNKDEFVLDVKWSCEPLKSARGLQSYCLSINLVQHLNVDDLLRKLLQYEVTPTSVSRSLIKQKMAVDPDSDISATSLKVSLLCPLGKMRIKDPTRHKTCNHLQCFDATLFIRMNQLKPTWVCPVCNKPADFFGLRRDGMFVEILKENHSHEIEFSPDGDWHSAARNSDIVIVDTPQRLNNQPIDLSVRSSPVKEESNVDVIDLTCDSGEDDVAPALPDDSVMLISSSPLDESPDSRSTSTGKASKSRNKYRLRQRDSPYSKSDSFSDIPRSSVTSDSSTSASVPFSSTGSSVNFHSSSTLSYSPVYIPSPSPPLICSSNYLTYTTTSPCYTTGYFQYPDSADLTPSYSIPSSNICPFPSNCTPNSPCSYCSASDAFSTALLSIKRSSSPPPSQSSSSSTQTSSLKQTTITSHFLRQPRNAPANQMVVSSSSEVSLHSPTTSSIQSTASDSVQILEPTTSVIQPAINTSTLASTETTWSLSTTLPSPMIESDLRSNEESDSFPLYTSYLDVL